MSKVEIRNEILTIDGKPISSEKVISRLIVGSQGNFATISEAVEWFILNATGPMEILLDAGHHPISDTIVIDATYPLAIRGCGSNSTFIEAASGLENKPMFELKSDCDFKSVSFDGSTLSGWKDSDNAKIITITGSGVYSEITDFIMDTGARGVCMKSDSEVFVFNFIIRNMRQVGIGFSSEIAGGALDIEMGNFENCALGINLYKGIDVDVYLSGLRFLNQSGQVGVNRIESDFSYSFFRMDHCDHNFVGTFLQGFDFSLARDANIDILDCNNYPDNNPRADAEIFGATSGNVTTLPSSVNVWTKLIMPTPTTTLKKFSWDDVNKKLIYLSDYQKGGMLTFSGTIQTGASPRTVEIALFQNPGDGPQPVGTPILRTLLRTTASNVPFVVSACSSVALVQKDDEFQWWVRSPSHANFTMTLQDMNLHVELR